MLITRISPFSHKKHTIDIPVTHEQLAEWEGGKLIQNAMPNLNVDQREFILTGITPEEWEEVFGGGE